MKKFISILALSMCGFLMYGMLVSCAGTEKTSPTKSIHQLMSSVGTVLLDSTIQQLPDSTMADIRILEDSLLHIALTSQDPDSIVVAKAFNLFIMNSTVMTGKVKTIEDVDDLVARSERIQFEFNFRENEYRKCYNLLNYFCPTNHDSDGAYFDFFIYIDKTTGKCHRISVIMPDFCDGMEEAPTFYALLRNNITDDKEDGYSLEGFKMEYNESNKCWTAVADGKEFNKLLSHSHLFFFVADSEGKEETSCVNLRYFHKQYKP